MGLFGSDAQVAFDEGTLLLEVEEAAPGMPHVKWDPRVRKWRAEACHFREIVEWLNRWDPAFDLLEADQGARYRRLQLRSSLGLEPRAYQREALGAWIQNGRKGTVVLPTGAGKTFLALQALQAVQASALIVVPTLALMAQWYELLAEAFRREVGLLGGGSHELRDLTVTTYESGYRYVHEFGDRFALLVFDEVHHLGPKYLQIARMSLAPFRLGLTATYGGKNAERIARFVGEPIYQRAPQELSGDYLSEYVTIRLTVELTPEERQAYEREYRLYKSYVERKGLEIWRERDWEAFLKKGAYDAAGRRALIAKRRAETIAQTAQRKLIVLDQLLKRHAHHRILIFTAGNAFAYRISQEFLIPAITHQTKAKERSRILRKFKRGESSMLVTSHVLDEGVDVPEANVGIILGGSAATREYVQRLGRLLRKSGERKLARLYEVIAQETMERHVSQRRRGRQGATGSAKG